MAERARTSSPGELASGASEPGVHRLTSDSDAQAALTPTPNGIQVDTSPRSSTRVRIARATRLAFWAASLLFLIGTAWLASVNNQPGGWDSLATLGAARNIASGRGFVSDFVPNYVERYTLPGPEVTRAPGMSYLLGVAFRVFGVSLATAVWVNGIIILLTAWLLRAAIRLDGGDWWADVAGMAMLVIRPPLVQALNNGALMLTTAAMLAVVVLAIRGRITGLRLAVACAGITAVGFYMKQTFMLSGGAAAVLLLATDLQRTWPRRARDCLVFGVLFLVLTSPHWLSNVLQYGEPLYSPINRFHWPTRFGVYPWYEHIRAVLFDRPYETLGSVVDRVGLVQMFRSELNYMRERAVAIAGPNPFLLIPAALGVLLFRRRHWRIYAAVATLMIGPLFDTMYWMVEPRYLLPLFPCLLFLGWLAVRSYREWACEAMGPALVRRVSIGFAAVLAAAAIHAVVMGWPPLRQEITNARRAETPPWKAIIERLPADIVVMSDLPPAVPWWTARRAIVTPLADRSDLLEVLRLYEPDYYLDLGSPTGQPPLSAWSPGELERIADGAGWSLHRIRVPVMNAEDRPGARPMPDKDSPASAT